MTTPIDRYRDRPGIPTKHKDRQFRSRLEARWGAFFDLMEWKYEYEPFDLNGWIPDFILFEDGGESEGILVEIKPVLKFPEDVAAKIIAAHPSHQEVLVLGCTIITDSVEDHPDSPRLGWLLHDTWSDPEDRTLGIWQSTAVLGYWGEFGKPFRSDQIGITSFEQDWSNRIGPGAGKFYWHDREVTSVVSRRWAEAGNISQWKAPR